MVDRTRYVITRGYGQCIEAMQRCDEQIRLARVRKDDAEVAALAEDRRQWLALANVTPRFVHEAEAARNG